MMKKIVIPISALFVAGLSYAQTTPSTTENYIYTKTYLSDPTLSSPKTSETVQYFDGLGRPKQVVSVKASPLGKDVVTPIEYDAFGRQVKDYLPVPQSSTLNGAIVPNPLGNATSVYGAEKIYAEKVLENSPLDRILQQKQVGTAWDTKPVKFEYDTNVSGEIIKMFTTTIWENGATKSTIEHGGTYATGQLYKNTITDEDGNKTIEFKNGRGQTLVVRKVLNPGEYADTYYVYNEYDQLAWVIPPLLSKKQMWGWEDQQALSYEYRYDGRNRLVEKRLPGKGWEYMVYDKQDRLVMTQDANLGASKQWIFTKYDQFGRVAYTGIYTSSQSYSPAGRAAEQTLVDAKGSNNVTRTSSVGVTVNGRGVYYDNNASTSYPNSITSLLSINYYDTYASYSFNPTFPADILGTPVITDNATANAISTKGLPVMSLVKNIEDDNWTTNYSYYDNKGRVIATHSVNHLGGYTRVESLLDFAGVPQQTITRHKRLAADTERVITETFTYDSQNRLLVHKHKVDNNAEEILTQNTYNEISQLTNKKVGGIVASNPLQSIDYTYNIRGWLTKINDPSAALTGGKLFGYEIKYINPANTTYSIARYNGNIAEVDWRTSNDNVLRRYSYSYDSLNRLNYGHYAEPGTTQPLEDYFGESIEYDLNGNITRLYRNAKNATNGMAMQVDNLTYAYAGNRLNTVTDTSQNYAGYPDVSGNFIGYDLNGNMTDHKDKGILDIDYNHLNLPDKLIFDQTYIPRDFSRPVNVRTEYLYNALGGKLRKKYYHKNPILGGTGEELITTDYLDGFQYEAKQINDDPSTIALKFVPTAEGYFNFENNKYIYNYVDHLGNIRLSYFNNGTGTRIIEENNYYPFGLKHEGYNGGTRNSAYQYKYNGKELQTESGMYDFGARMYMPDIGRWGVIDPAAELGRRFSPYNYAFDNPVIFIDPDGMWPWPTWGQIKSFGRGAWNTTVGMVKGLAASNGISGVLQGGREFKKVYNAYQTGGASAAVKQYGKSLYETSGAKAIVQTVKGVAKGDAESMGSATVMVAAAVITHKAAGGTKTGGKVAAVETSTMNELTNTVKSTVADLKAAGKAPATVVGAELNGQTVVGTSGPPPATIAPQLEGVVGELGGLGTKTASGNTVGCCSEFHTGNQLLLDNPSATPSQINFTEAIRPRDGSVIPMCDNCKTTFNK